MQKHIQYKNNKIAMVMIINNHTNSKRIVVK